MAGEEGEGGKQERRETEGANVCMYVCIYILHVGACVFLCGYNACVKIIVVCLLFLKKKKKKGKHSKCMYVCVCACWGVHACV